MCRRVGDEPAERQLRVQVDGDSPARRQACLQKVAGHRVGRAVPLGEGHGADVHDGEGRAVADVPYIIVRDETEDIAEVIAVAFREN